MSGPAGGPAEGAGRGGGFPCRNPTTAAVLTEPRKVPPHALDGGEPGAVGRNWVERADGSIEELEATGSIAMNPGDVFIIETPGGGGFGKQ